MTASQPLTELDLIDCAQANSKQGLEVAAKQCGYGQDTDRFIECLQAACTDIGVEVQELKDLIVQQQAIKVPGIEIAPDSPSEL
jgi:hypothetical protein